MYNVINVEYVGGMKLMRNKNEEFINYNTELKFNMEAYKQRIQKHSAIQMRLIATKYQVTKTPNDLKNQMIANLIALTALVISVVIAILTLRH
jgi:hypothetical protein